MKKIELDIVALSHSVTQSHNYAVVLGEQDGSRRLPIVIGGFEAQAIAVAMERMTPNRPLTHDLFTSLALSYNIYLKEVMIHKLKNGIFYSTLVCELNGEIKQIDSRTSDAIALALRFNCPIYTYEGILKQAGFILDEKKTTNLSLANYSSESSDDISTKKTLNFNIAEQTKSELNSKLTVALEKEDYDNLIWIDSKNRE